MPMLRTRSSTPSESEWSENSFSAGPGSLVLRFDDVAGFLPHWAT